MNLLDYGQENYAAVKAPYQGSLLDLFSYLKTLGKAPPGQVARGAAPANQATAVAPAAPAPVLGPSRQPASSGSTTLSSGASGGGAQSSSILGPAAPAPPAIAPVLQPRPAPSQRPEMYGLQSPQQAALSAFAHNMGQAITGGPNVQYMSMADARRTAAKDLQEADQQHQRTELLRMQQERLQAEFERDSAAADRLLAAQEAFIRENPEYAAEVRAGGFNEVLGHQLGLSKSEADRAHDFAKIRANLEADKELERFKAETGSGGSSNVFTPTTGTIRLSNGSRVSVNRVYDKSGRVTFTDIATNQPIPPEFIVGDFSPSGAVNPLRASLGPNGEFVSEDTIEAKAQEVDAANRFIQTASALKQFLIESDTPMKGSLEGIFANIGDSAMKQVQELLSPIEDLVKTGRRFDETEFTRDKWFGSPGTVNYLVSEVVLLRAIEQNPNKAKLTDGDMQRAKESITAASVQGQIEKLDIAMKRSGERKETAQSYLNRANQQANQVPLTAGQQIQSIKSGQRDWAAEFEASQR